MGSCKHRIDWWIGVASISMQTLNQRAECRLTDLPVSLSHVTGGTLVGSIMQHNTTQPEN